MPSPFPFDDLARDLTGPPARPHVVKVVNDYAKDRRLCYTLALGVTGLAAYTAYQTSQPDIAVQFREVDEERRAKAKRKQREAEARRRRPSSPPPRLRPLPPRAPL